MKYEKEYDRIIATKERSAGNDSVGDMWVDTKSFDRNTEIHEIIKWAENCTGKLIITIDEDTIPKSDFSKLDL